MGSTTMTPEQFTAWVASLPQEIAKALQNPTFLRALAMKAQADVQGFFQASQGPDGTAWAPLKFARPRGGSKPLLDTGRLRASCIGRVLAENDGIAVGTNAIQAGLMNDGGTITPKRTKFLAIPLTRKAQLSGSPLNYGGKLFFRGTDQKGAWMETTGKGKKKKVMPVFALVRSVTIPAREFLGFSEDFLTFAERLAVDQMTKAVTK